MMRMTKAYDYYGKKRKFSFRYLSGKETSLEYHVNEKGSESLWFSLGSDSNRVCYKLMDAVFTQYKLSGEKFFKQAE